MLNTTIDVTTLELWANWTTIDTIHLKDNTFVIGVRIKATVVSRHLTVHVVSLCTIKINDIAW